MIVTSLSLSVRKTTINMASTDHEQKEAPYIAHVEAGLHNDVEVPSIKPGLSGQAATDECVLAGRIGSDYL
jgi:hypothetical protein